MSQRLIILMILIMLSNTAIAESKQKFMTIKGSKVNMRTGPSRDYPIKAVYTLAKMPVKQIDQFDDWIMVEDIDGERGWIFHVMLSYKVNHAVFRKNTKCYKKNNSNSKVVMTVDKMVIAKIKKCHNDWCKVDINKKNGWARKKDLWGVVN